jgi:OmpA-OmpF porin, OOP family
VTTDPVAQLMFDLRGDTLDRVASALGESPARIETALGAVLPAILSGLARRAATIAGASVLLDLIRLNQLDSARYRDAPSAIAAHDGVINLINAGRPALDAALGGRTGSVVDWISSYAGLNRSSGLSLLTMALPLVVGQIVRLVGAGRLNAWNLQSLLTEQRGLLEELPGLSAALGIANVRSVQTPARVRSAVTDSTQTRSWTAWWEWPLRLALIVLIPVSFSVGRRADPGLVVKGQVPLTQAAVATVGAFIAPASSIRIPSGGIESRLLAFIENPDAKVEEQPAFTLDRLEFGAGSATLKPSSREQLRNVTAILNVYPNVHLKIAGYMDDAGDAARNLRLSAERATATMDEIARLGIDRSRLQAEGYGPQRNSRIDIRVTKK